MFLAEANPISGGLLFLILVVMLIVIATGLALAIAGCVWAYRAGRGSRLSRVGLGVAVAVEIFCATLGRKDSAVVAPVVVVLVIQAIFFLFGRSQGPNASTGSEGT
ncbi:MAG TPA: hypothetical protein VMY34_10385 [Acidimicrobiales bacterium]|nr:hypothetical protein [Acidimicrobiales bacterium]